MFDAFSWRISCWSPSSSRRKVRWKKGFTLLEILAVLTVSAILMILLLPATRSAWRAAQSATCLSNVRQLTTGGLQYAADNQGKLPTTDWTATTRMEMYWHMKVSVYTNPENPPYFPVFRCPAVETMLKRTKKDPSLLWANVDYSCLYAAPPNLPEGRPIYLQQLQDRSKTGMVVEGDGQGHAGPYSQRVFDLIVTPALSRHGNWINMSFCDGHVEKVKNPTFSDFVRE